jgi:hypothetical protein
VSSILVLAACQGPTTVDVIEQSGPYVASVRMDPPTLNPPQIGSLTFEVKDAQTGKAVTEFEPVHEALLHNVLVHGDLLYFDHSATDRLVQGGASVQVFFPRTGTYYSYALYKPRGADLQVFKVSITTGTPTHGAHLVDDSNVSKVNGGVRFDLLKSASPIRAGQPVQLVFHVTERGRPVDYLWPVYGAAGHLWIVDEAGEYFAHETGAAQTHRYLTGMGTPTSGVLTPLPTMPAGGRSAVTTPVPTFAPGIVNAMRTITAAPVPTLAPVQQTAMASLLGTPDVLPDPGFGPDIVFTHTFPHAGMYKMWLQVRHRGEVIHVDYAVRVEP